jgi:rhodanese-related sulfurtransferase
LLSPARLAAIIADGGEVVDLRPVHEFAAAHIPGSLSIPLRPEFATWLGWLARPDAALVLVSGADRARADLREAAWQALKIGYQPVGELDGGLPAWTGEGRRVTSTALTTPAQFATAPPYGTVLDIRQAGEFTAGHLPGAVHRELGTLTGVSIGGGGDDQFGEVAVIMCGHGERAMSAASVLERAGRTGVTVLDGGPPDWSAASGTALETGM